MTSQYLSVGCFGKLPCYTEYLEENISLPSSRALKSWIHEGRAEARFSTDSTGGPETHETLHRRFVYGIPGSVELAVGVIRPSHDQGGHRRFPFMLVTHVPRRHFGKSYSLMPLALGEVWDALDDAWDTFANLESLAAFRELFGSTMVPAPPPVEEVRSGWQDLQQESSGRLFAGHDDDTLEALKGGFPEFLRRLGKGGESQPLELPISAALQDACADAAFWLEAINHQFFWKRYEPALFLEGAPQKKNRQVLMVFGIIRAQDYATILGCGEGGARLTRPARAAVPPEPGQESGRPPEEGPTFAELLKGLSGH